MQTKAGVILNPVAGKKRGKLLLPDLLEGLCRRNILPIVHVTSKRRDAERAAIAFGKDCDMLCCIGGDGTLNEVICGLMCQTVRPPLLYIPTGSTNDFAQTCGIPSDLNRAMELVASNQTRTVDIGCLCDRYFTYIASFGLFTRTTYATDQSVKNIIGHMAYLLEGAKELSDLGKSYHVKITHDTGSIEGDFLFGGVANTLSIGGIFHLPRRHVVLDDGKFELMLIRLPKNADELLRAFNMMQSGAYDGDLIRFLSTTKVKFKSDQPISWCLDGEYAGDRAEACATNLARSLTLYAQDPR